LLVVTRAVRLGEREAPHPGEIGQTSKDRWKITPPTNCQGVIDEATRLQTIIAL
jgi:hypothetical protein